MATVSAFLVQISSSLVQDFYHRFINPRAEEKTLRRLSHLAIVSVALLGMLGALKAPLFLQALIVFAGGAAACAYLVPAAMACFWRRATPQGAQAAMIGGVGTVLLLYIPGWIRTVVDPAWDPGIDAKSSFYPEYLLGMAPFVWGLVVSAVLGFVVSLSTPAPPKSLQRRFFGETDG